MERQFHIFGSGGIGQAAILALELCFPDSMYYVYDVNFTGLDHYFKELDENLKLRIIRKKCDISTEGNLQIQGDFVLDCAPGHLAPCVSRIAMKNGIGYINLTEYVHETEIIKKSAANYNDSALVLQSGVAPGFVNIVGKSLVEQAKDRSEAVRLETLDMMVGALSENARGPHYYAFTWSPIGVATEYLKPSNIVKNHVLTQINSLECITGHYINGEHLESSHTSGGVADLAEKYAQEIDNISYQTLRYPGHFQWVKQLIQKKQITDPGVLLTEMERIIPFVENDIIVIYSYLDYFDASNRLNSISATYKVRPNSLFGVNQRAIQISTAVPMVVSIDWILSENKRGLITQSMIDSDFVLNHKLIKMFFEKQMDKKEEVLVYN